MSAVASPSEAGHRRGWPASLGNRTEIEVLVDDQAEEIEGLRAALKAAESRLTVLEQRISGVPSPEQLARVGSELDATPFLDIPGDLRVINRSGRPAIGFTATTLRTGADYVDFERVFRGSTERIASLLAGYIPLLRGREPILDLGCGRGEVLDLCRDAGIASRGVDLNPDMVQCARSHAHEVTCADALSYLASLEDQSLGAVISIQVIEHLLPETIPAICKEAARVLRPGGIFVAETINPHSIQGLKTFSVDLTHRHPIFPEVLTLTALISGFDEGIVVFPHGTGQLERDRRYCTEYALVAQTAAAKGA